MDKAILYSSRKFNLGERFLLFAAAFLLQFLTIGQMATAQVSAAPASANEVHERGDISGTWQGTVVQNGKSFRTILIVTKTDKGWSMKVYSIDRSPQPLSASSVTLDGSSFKWALDMVGVSYEGKVSADGSSIVGTWTENSSPVPLTILRATKETAWELPAPPQPVKLMAVDADPSFDVATIKPNPSGGTQMQGLNVNGRNFSTKNSSLEDLVGFAYNVQARQIVNGPDWMEKDRYDIAGVPDKEGAPSVDQLRTMMRKLLADRFKLTIHQEKRELPAFVLTVGKNGQKVTPSQQSQPLPSFGMGPSPSGLKMTIRNGKMEEFCGFLQMLVLDRPVVDQTGLKDRFDFQFTFTPDDSQFNGHPPKAPAPTDTIEPAPGLFDALQQQVGLKLSSEKAQVGVIAIDHVEKPSQN